MYSENEEHRTYQLDLVIDLDKTSEINVYKKQL